MSERTQKTWILIRYKCSFILRPLLINRAICWHGRSLFRLIINEDSGLAFENCLDEVVLRVGNKQTPVTRNVSSKSKKKTIKRTLRAEHLISYSDKSPDNIEVCWRAMVCGSRFGASDKRTFFPVFYFSEAHTKEGTQRDKKPLVLLSLMRTARYHTKLFINLGQSN